MLRTSEATFHQTMPWLMGAAISMGGLGIVTEELEAEAIRRVESKVWLMEALLAT